MTADDAAQVANVAKLTWLTRHEAATYARVGLRTIDRWLASGQLRSSGGAGDRRLIRRDWLDQWLEERHCD